MRSGIGIWALGLVVSALLHLGAAVGLMAALQPEPLADQPVPESRLNVEAQQVERSQASEQKPASEQATSETTTGTALGLGAIAQSVAPPLAAPSETARPKDANALAERTRPQAPKATIAPVAEPAAQKPALRLPQSTKAITAPLTLAAVALDVPAAAPLAPSTPQVTQSGPQATPSLATPAQEPEVTASKAVLAFPAGGSVDPVSLAAFQSFTQPDAAQGTDLRDSLSSALALPCARMQITFDPDTTTLQVTGHVPDASQRDPVLAALQAQMGADIAVTENLLILPAPQCGALSGIAEVGLPQSTDQITNPLIVGADTHARAFRYVTGDPLVLELTAPDYPAYVYVDYFDADGNVIHLSPNERAPLQLAAEKTALQIGARSQDAPGLFVTIGPPYGQEIAAAFAASVPLYDGVRPLVEPADAYLRWMQERVAEARAEHPDFKGEWVYFFVTTAAE